MDDVLPFLATLGCLSAVVLAIVWAVGAAIRSSKPPPEGYERLLQRIGLLEANIRALRQWVGMDQPDGTFAVPSQRWAPGQAQGEPYPIVSPTPPVAPRPVTSPTPMPAPAPIVTPTPSPQPAWTPAREMAFERIARDAYARPSEPEPKPERTDIETLLGGKWALWIGVVLVLMCASFGLKLAWEGIGPGGRTLIGLAAGVLFLLAGAVARERTESWFDKGLSACGIALLYLTLWAAAVRYEILGVLPAFGAMSLVTALCVGLSLRYDSMSLMVLAIAGGFLTPVLLSGGTGESGPEGAYRFLGYLTVLNAGILAAVTARRWRPMSLLALLATTWLVLVWLLTRYSPIARWETFGFLSLNYALFLAAGCAYSLRMRVASEPYDLAYLVLACAAYLGAGLAVLPESPEWARGAFSGVLSVVCFALGWAALVRLPKDTGLIATGFALSALFLTIAFPLMLSDQPLAIGWAGQALALTIIGCWAKKQAFASVGLGVLVLSACLLAWTEMAGARPASLFGADAQAAGLGLAVAVSLAATVLHLWRRGELRWAAEVANLSAALTSVLALWLWPVSCGSPSTSKAGGRRTPLKRAAWPSSAWPCWWRPRTSCWA